MELESKVSERAHSGIRVDLVDVVHGSTLNDGTPPPQQYCIATRRERRNICPP